MWPSLSTTPTWLLPPHSADPAWTASTVSSAFRRLPDYFPKSPRLLKPARLSKADQWRTYDASDVREDGRRLFLKAGASSAASHPHTILYSPGQTRRNTPQHSNSNPTPLSLPCALRVSLASDSYAYAMRSEEHTSELQSLRHLVC